MTTRITTKESTKKDSLISIIVPVYNVEKYLKKCLDSLICQSYTNIEIILINDGSTDSSLNIVNEYALLDERIIVVSQINQGLSSARNLGLKLANGDFLMFVDSDDWIAQSTCEFFITKALQSGSDVVVGNVICVNDENSYEYPYCVSKNIGNDSKAFSGIEYFAEVVYKKTYTVMVCAYFYRKAFLIKHNLHFENVIHEDELWTPLMLFYAQKIVYTDFNFYYYRQRASSIMQCSCKHKRINSLLFIIGSLLDFLTTIVSDEKNNDERIEIWQYTGALLFKINDLYSILFALISILQKNESKAFVLERFPFYDLFFFKNLPLSINSKHSKSFHQQLTNYRRCVLTVQEQNEK